MPLLSATRRTRTQTQRIHTFLSCALHRSQPNATQHTMAAPTPNATSPTTAATAAAATPPLPPLQQQQQEASSLSCASLSALLCASRQQQSQPPYLFPHEVYDLLEDVDRRGRAFTSIVSWMADGRSFRIDNQTRFEECILPLYFFGMTSYRSFRRQLNNYGIYQDRGLRTYSHRYLVRGERHHCDQIVRKANSRYRPRAEKRRRLLLGAVEEATATTTTTSTATTATATSTESNVRNTNTANGNASNVSNAIAPNASTSLAVPTPTAAPVSMNGDSNYNNHDKIALQGSRIKNIDNAHLHVHDNIIRAHTIHIHTPNPVNLRFINNSNTNAFLNNYTSTTNQQHTTTTANSNSNSNNNALRSFLMDQYWGGLPKHISPLQIVDEIIATFKGQQKQKQQQQQQQQRRRRPATTTMCTDGAGVPVKYYANNNNGNANINANHERTRTVVTNNQIIATVRRHQQEKQHQKGRQQQQQQY